MSGLIKEPLTYVITKQKNVTSGTTMITRAPWPNGRYYRIRKIECTTLEPSVSGVLWKFWDQDLSSSTTAGVGSAANALIYVTPTTQTSGVAAISGFGGNSVNKPFDAAIRQAFYAGITVQTINSSNVSLELEVV